MQCCSSPLRLFNLQSLSNVNWSITIVHCYNFHCYLWWWNAIISENYKLPSFPWAAEPSIAELRRCQKRSSKMATGEDMPTFKLVLVGDGGTGKTTFVKVTILGHASLFHICLLSATWLVSLRRSTSPPWEWRCTPWSSTPTAAPSGFTTIPVCQTVFGHEMNNKKAGC